MFLFNSLFMFKKLIFLEHVFFFNWETKENLFYFLNRVFKHNFESNLTKHVSISSISKKNKNKNSSFFLILAIRVDNFEATYSLGKSL